MTDNKKIFRSCLTCACHHVQENQLNKMEKQSFCRRNPPTAAKMRGERPQMLHGQPRFMKDGKTPIMETYDAVLYLYAPVMENLVCYDGWRPIGTEPGERANTELSDSLTRGMVRLFKDMMADASLDAESAALRDLPVDPDAQKN